MNRAYNTQARFHNSFIVSFQQPLEAIKITAEIIPSQFPNQYISVCDYTMYKTSMNKTNRSCQRVFNLTGQIFILIRVYNLPTRKRHCR